MTRKVLIGAANSDLSCLKVSKVTLEEVVLHDETNCTPAIIGRARVLNLGFEKSVFARISFDSWATYRDYKASYLQSCEGEDGNCDIFGFGFPRNDKSPIDVEFALSCTQNGVQYWDNNNGKNYHFQLSEDVWVTETPELYTPWQTTGDGELILEESDYPHFQPHPLTPTKIRFYSTIRHAPEKEIIPTKAKDSKHVRAFNALALESLSEISITPQEGGVQEAVSSCFVEEECCGVNILGENGGGDLESQDTKPSDAQPPQSVEEESIEPVKILKRGDSKSEDAIFEKLEKETSPDITNEEQEVKEPCADSKKDENDALVAVSEKNQMIIKDSSNEASPEQRKPAETEGGNGVKGTLQDTDDANRKTATSDKGQTKPPSPGEVENSPSPDERQIIENEGAPKKKKKKGMFSKLCCGKAEYD